MAGATSGCGVSELLGTTLQHLIRTDNQLLFQTTTGDTYLMYHRRECCEEVWLEEIHGDLRHLLYTPILLAEEVSNDPLPPLFNHDERFLWTFYKFATIKGYVTMRWYGRSNGCYAEQVNFERVYHGKGP